MGYSAIGREVLEKGMGIEAKESFDIDRVDVASAEREDNKFPQHEVPDLKEKVQRFAHQALMLIERLLRGLAEDLNIDPKEFLTFVPYFYP